MFWYFSTKEKNIINYVTFIFIDYKFNLKVSKVIVQQKKTEDKIVKYL